MPRWTEAVGLLAFLVGFHGLFFCGNALAEEELQGEIRFEPAAREVAWVGQEVELNLDLWSNGFSFGDQLFVLPEVKGGYLMQADSSTVKLSENRDGVPWQGLRYTLLFYPQRQGSLEVPSFSVRFTARAGFGSQPASFQYQTPALRVDARLPPGVAPGSLLVTTDAFEMNWSWDRTGEPDGPIALKVGDALTLEVTREARDVPGMVFAPLPRLTIDGLAAYPDPARVDDRVNRGSLTGSRTDSITFICEREGRYSIPAFRFQWWDPSTELLSEKVIPGMELAVSDNPAFQQTSPTADQTGYIPNWKLLLAAFFSLALLGYFARRAFPNLSRAWQQRQEKKASGEAWAFRQVCRACAEGSASNAYNAINTWLDRCRTDRTGLTLGRLAAQSGDPALVREARLLQENVISVEPRAWNGRELARLLKRLRRGFREVRKSSSRLAPINPPMSN